MQERVVFVRRAQIVDGLAGLMKIMHEERGRDGVRRQGARIKRGDR